MSDLMYPTMFAIMAKDSNFSNFDDSYIMTHKTIMTHNLWLITYELKMEVEGCYEKIDDSL